MCMGMLFFNIFFNILIIFYAKYEKNIFIIIANIFAVIHLASYQCDFEVEQQLLHNTEPTHTKKPLCESGGVEQPLYNTGPAQA